MPPRRRLRRLLRPTEQISPETGERVVAPLARILFATVSRHGSRWHVSLNVSAPDLHSERRHPRGPGRKRDGWVGIDRGLTVFAVAATADGEEVGRSTPPNHSQGGCPGCAVPPEPCRELSKDPEIG